MIIFAFLCLFEPPLGSLPQTWDLYKAKIDINKQTFTCFDGSKTISLSKVNDNYQDCPDGSDEPGTSALLNKTKFYCKTDEHFVELVDRWSVGDGICDCCDGSDEFYNTRVKCKNTCGKYLKDRQKYIKKLEKKYNNALSMQKSLAKSGEKEVKKVSNQLYITRGKFYLIDCLFGYVKNFNIVNDSNPTKWRLMLINLCRITFQHPSNRTSFIQALKDALITDLTKLNATTSRQYKHSMFLSTNYDNSNYSFVKLHNSKHQHGEYSIKFNKWVKQGSIKIGKFSHSKNSIFIYTNGEFCDVINSERTFNMTLECRFDNKLISVTETSTCKYYGVFGTPIACKVEDKEKIYKMSIHDLENLAHKMDINL